MLLDDTQITSVCLTGYRRVLRPQLFPETKTAGRWLMPVVLCIVCGEAAGKQAVDADIDQRPVWLHTYSACWLSAVWWATWCPSMPTWHCLSFVWASRRSGNAICGYADSAHKTMLMVMWWTCCVYHIGMPPLKPIMASVRRHDLISVTLLPVLVLVTNIDRHFCFTTNINLLKWIKIITIFVIIIIIIIFNSSKCTYWYSWCTWSLT